MRPAAVLLLASLVGSIAWAVGGDAVTWLQSLLFGPVLRFGLLWLLVIGGRRAGWHLLWLFWVFDVATLGVSEHRWLDVVVAAGLLVELAMLVSPTLRRAGRARSRDTGATGVPG